MNTANKVVPLARIVEVVRQIRQGHRSIILTNGCFDLLHAGHVNLLDRIKRECGERSFVIVGVNADDSVRALKGPARPVNAEADRAEVVAGLQAVDCVVIFRDKRVNKLIELIEPDVWVKGGDYTEATLDREELEAARNYSVEILILPLTPGKSTTGIISRLVAGGCGGN